jgi:hypothetical protein
MQIVKTPNTSLLLVDAMLPEMFMLVNRSMHTTPPEAK